MLQDDDHETTGNALLLSDPLLVSSSYQKSGSLEFADIITPKEVEEETATGNPSPRRILLTVDAAIDHPDVGMGRFQYGILVAAGFCFAADGILIMLLTFLGPILQYEWQLSPAQTAWITSIVFVGAFVGTLIFGPLADLVGRKPIFMLAAIVISIFGTGVAFVQTYTLLLGTLFLVGIGIGGLTVPFDIFAEFLPSQSRGKNLLCIEYFWTIGVLLVVGAAYMTLDDTNPSAPQQQHDYDPDQYDTGDRDHADVYGTPPHWRVFVIICTVPCWISIGIGYWFVPESPRWLCTQHRNEEALGIIRTAVRMNNKNTNTNTSIGNTSIRNNTISNDNGSRHHPHQYRHQHQSHHNYHPVDTDTINNNSKQSDNDENRNNENNKTTVVGGEDNNDEVNTGCTEERRRSSFSLLYTEGIQLINTIEEDEQEQEQQSTSSSISFVTNTSATTTNNNNDNTATNNFLILLSPRWKLTMLKLCVVHACFAFQYYGTIIITTEIFNNNNNNNNNNDTSLENNTTIFTPTTSTTGSSFTSSHNNTNTNNFDYSAIFISSSAEIIGTTIAIIAIDRIGRIPLQVMSYSLAGILVCLLYIVTAYNNDNNTDTNNDQELSLSISVLSSSSLSNDHHPHFYDDHYRRTVLIVLGFCARIFEMTGTCTTWVSTAEILSTKVRSTGHSLANAIARLGAFFSPFLVYVGGGSDDSSSMFSSLYLQKGFLMLAVHVVCVLCVSTLPETKGSHMGQHHQQQQERHHRRNSS